MHIMKNMCDDYNQLKLLNEKTYYFLDGIENLQSTVKDHWETYCCDNEYRK